MGSRWNDAASGPPSGPSTRPTHCSPSQQVRTRPRAGGVDVDEPVAVDADQVVGRAAAVVTGDEAAEAVVRVLDGRHRCAVVVDPFDRHELTEQVVAVVGPLGTDASLGATAQHVVAVLGAPRRRHRPGGLGTDAVADGDGRTGDEAAGGVVPPALVAHAGEAALGVVDRRRVRPSAVMIARLVAPHRHRALLAIAGRHRHRGRDGRRSRGARPSSRRWRT